MISVLPQNIANQIAAGEVVNRPASVVKELIENSIDAGSEEITLVTKDAGRTLIEVIDAGCGMDEQDSRKCFLEHATSKIKSEEDLRNLTTMGFRGEALASIAAISQVEMRTKMEGEELGNEIFIEGGEIKSFSKCTAKKGTDIKVKNIFFNVPARRSFLKSDSIENSHILDSFIRIASVYNNISFTYIRDGIKIYSLEKNNTKKRLSDIFGKGYNENLLPIDEEIDLVKIRGFVGNVNLKKKNKNTEYFFVNQRYFRSPYFANAVERAYQNLLPPHNYPVFFLFLTVDPQNIDVNIHPTKTEVKFIDDKIIYAILNSAVRKVLGQNTIATTLDFDKKTLDFSSPNGNGNMSPSKISYSNSYNPFAKVNANPSFDFSAREANIKVQTEISFDNFGKSAVNKEDNIVPSLQTFQYLNRYIITQICGDVIIISQSRASKKIIFESLKNSVPLHIDKENLLIKYTKKYSPIEIISLRDKEKTLNLIGFDFTIRSDGNVVFSSFPKGMTNLESMNIVDEFIGEEVVGDEKLLSISERLAIKDGKILSSNEMNTLVKGLFDCSNAEFLPMNERVYLNIDRKFLDKVFI